MQDQTMKCSVSSWDVKNTVAYTLTVKGSWKIIGEPSAGFNATVQGGVTSLNIPYAGDWPQTLHIQKQ
jgi:hypothetical protein